MKTDPAAQCRFFTAEDACRVALAAYFAARSPLPARDFAASFVGEFLARFGTLAKGHPKIGELQAEKGAAFARPIAPERHGLPVVGDAGNNPEMEHVRHG